MTPPLQGRRALVVGGSGGIGGAFVEALGADARYSEVVSLHRRSTPAIDFDHEASIGEAAQALSVRGPFHCVINAVGVLHTDRFMPEKKLDDLDYDRMLATFRINTFGPALLLRHFAPLLDKERAVFALLSAKVGSIGDNRLGGWASYRASKAALNMVVKTAAIELARTRPGAIVVALHPGTVATRLSRPFRGDTIGRAPQAAVMEMLAVLDTLVASDSGTFIAYDGTRLPW